VVKKLWIVPLACRRLTGSPLSGSALPRPPASVNIMLWQPARQFCNLRVSLPSANAFS
jgi:hypothetical protein